MPLPHPPPFEYDLALLPVPGKKRATMFDVDRAAFVEAPNIAIKSGKIAAMGDDVQAELAQAVRYVQKGQVISPEIYDIHTHLANGVVWSQKVDPDRDVHAWGTGFAVDAGSTGHVNGPPFFEDIRTRRTRTHRRAFINIAPHGLVLPDGETSEENFWHADIDRTVGVAKDYADVVVGMKVRIGSKESGNNWRNALTATIAAAEKIGKPLMVHVSDGPPPLEEVLALLRRGDIVTHCFHGKHPQNMFTILRDGKILDAVVKARDRGVRFDVGHGGGSFDWAVVTAAAVRGFLPDSCSSDFHDYSRHNAKNQLNVMSKLIHVGMDMRCVFAMATTNPARMINRPAEEMSRIAVGSAADLAVIDVLKAGEEGFPLVDGPSAPTKASIKHGRVLLQKSFLVTDGVAM